jgi:hypothetical protein
MALLALILALSGRHCMGLTDNVLCMPLPPGWSQSVAFGVADGRCAAWMFAGNFRFRRFPQNSEGTPDVPRGRVLITIGDFPVGGTAGRNWPRVERLRLPPNGETPWHVVFHHRALYLSVHFGSFPNSHMFSIVNARLGSVRRMHTHCRPSGA